MLVPTDATKERTLTMVGPVDSEPAVGSITTSGVALIAVQNSLMLVVGVKTFTMVVLNA